MKLQHFLTEYCDLEVRSYSGRGMYGKYCLGVDMDDYTMLPSIIMRSAYLLTEHEADQIADALESMCTDALGRGTIIYFPSVEFEGEEDED